MPKSTTNFNLIYAADREIITPVIEENRYLIIDKQLYGTFKVFGNGVINGWDITIGDGLSIIISAGNGIIGLKYCESTQTSALVNLIPNSIFYLQAKRGFTTISNFEPEFYISIYQDLSENVITLAKIETNSNTILSIDSDIRNNISFLQAAIDAIKNHRHFGGENPSQIDLSKEVRGKLSADNIEDLDASKITSGRLGEKLIPQLDHMNLGNIGTLTHAQLDSFVKMLTFENSHLLGEVSSSNLMQLYLSHKHFWKNIDDYASNLLLFIPGISPDSFIDVDATNAEIDKVNHLVKGLISITGGILTKTYNTTDDFKNYYTESNVVIQNNKVKLDKNAAEEKIIIDFDSATESGEEIPGFVKTVFVSSDEGGFKYTDKEKETGFFGGEMTVSQVVKLQYSKVIDPIQDWTDYDFIRIPIKSTSLSHGQINLMFYNKNGNGEEIAQTPITLLTTNEITDGFKNVLVTLSPFSRDKISRMDIYTDTSMGWDVADSFSIVLDDITVRKNSLYQEEGDLRYRISLPLSSQWTAIDWNFIANDGDVKIRARGAATESSLNLTPFKDFIEHSGDSPGVSDSSNFEIDVILTCSPDKTKTPELTFLRVTYIIPSSDSGFIVNTQEAWESGVLSNKIDAVTTPGSIRIKEPISVGDIFYSNSILVSEVDPDKIPVFGYRGNEVPASPYQVVQNDLNTGYDLVYCLRRLEGGNYLFCDTGNNRIMEIDPDGKFVFGFGSYLGEESELTVLTSVYKSNQSLLTLVLSKNTDVATVDLSKIEIRTEDEAIFLDSTDTILRDSSVSSSGTASNLKITLSNDHNDILAEKTTLRLVIKDGAFSESLSDAFEVTKSLRLNGITIFKGNFIYMNGIENPVSVELLENGNYLIANAKRWGRENVGFSSVIEVDTNGVTSFSFDQDNFFFTLDTLGMAKEYDASFFVFSGLVGTPSLIRPDSSEITKVIAHGGNPEVTEYQININDEFQLIADTYTKVSDKEVDIYGSRIFWSSSDISVVSVDFFGLVTAHGKGTATITAESSGVIGIATFKVDQDLKNPSLSTAKFTKTEDDIVKNAIGKTILVDRVSKKTRFEYDSADGMYPSSVDIEASTGLFVISEKSLVINQKGRIIKVDTNGNILFDFGFGEIDEPNSVRSLVNNDIVISS